MKKIIFSLLLCFSLYGNSQERFTLSGTIVEEQGRETLIGANIIIEDLNTGTISNEYGFYSITLNKGIYEVTISLSLIHI